MKSIYVGFIANILFVGPVIFFDGKNIGNISKVEAYLDAPKLNLPQINGCINLATMLPKEYSDEQQKKIL